MFNSKSTDNWKSKRKLSVSVFRRQNLNPILSKVRSLIKNDISKMRQKIGESSDGSCEVEILQMFRDLFDKTISFAVVGEDITKEEITLMARVDPKGEKPLVEKKLKLLEAINECIEQCVITAEGKMLNPLTSTLFHLRGKNLVLTKFQKLVYQNCQTVRDNLRQKIDDRRSGKSKSKLEQTDFLSFVLEHDRVAGSAEKFGDS